MESTFIDGSSGLFARSNYMTRAAAMAVLMSLGVLPAAEKAPAKAKVDFSRAIRPLLANKCLKCHGPGQQQRASELRLDLRKSAIGTAIVPGRPDQSELVKRITSKDPQKRMPPPESKLELTDPEIALLKAWISDAVSYTHLTLPPICSV